MRPILPFRALTSYIAVSFDDRPMAHGKTQNWVAFTALLLNLQRGITSEVANQCRPFQIALDVLKYASMGLSLIYSKTRDADSRICVPTRVGQTIAHIWS